MYSVPYDTSHKRTRRTAGSSTPWHLSRHIVDLYYSFRLNTIYYASWREWSLASWAYYSVLWILLLYSVHTQRNTLYVLRTYTLRTPPILLKPQSYYMQGITSTRGKLAKTLSHVSIFSFLFSWVCHSVCPRTRRARRIDSMERGSWGREGLKKRNYLVAATALDRSAPSFWTWISFLISIVAKYSLVQVLYMHKLFLWLGLQLI
jgi:hypothetical protein